MKKSINIYIEKKDRKKIDDLKAKYRLSLTTICDILTFETIKAFIADGKKSEEVWNEYFYKNTPGTKTSIKKPKTIGDLLTGCKNMHWSRCITNALKLYINHDIAKYINSEQVKQDYYNRINQKLTTTTDDYYDYNNFIRYQRRNLRENKDYYKKEIEKMEHR